MTATQIAEDWKTWYESRTASPLGAAEFVKRGDHIWFPPGQQVNVAAHPDFRGELRKEAERLLGLK